MCVVDDSSDRPILRWRSSNGRYLSNHGFTTTVCLFLTFERIVTSISMVCSICYSPQAVSVFFPVVKLCTYSVHAVYL